MSETTSPQDAVPHRADQLQPPDEQLCDLSEELAAEHAGVVHPGRVHALVHQADRLLCVRDEQGEHRLDEVAAVVRRLLLREVASRSRRRA